MPKKRANKRLKRTLGSELGGQGYPTGGFIKVLL